MAMDAVAVLDAVGVEQAHLMGCSMGGMIVQRLAIDHPERVLSMTSVMSRTGEPGYGESSKEALAFLLAPPAPSRSAYIDRQVAALHVYGSKPEWLDDGALRARAAAAYDRCFCPEGVGRQMKAVMQDGSRTAELAEIDLPALVHPRQPRHAHRPERWAPDGRGHTRRPLRRDRGHGPRLPASGVEGVGGRLVRFAARRRPKPEDQADSGRQRLPPFPLACAVRCFHSDALAAMAAVSNRPAKYVHNSSARAIPIAP